MSERRMTILVGTDRLDRVNKSIRFGLRSHLVNAVLDLVLDAIDRDGERILGFILEGHYKLVRNEEDDKG